MKITKTARYQKRGNGPLLIYIAGLDGTGLLFFRQQPELEKRFQVITYPLRFQTLFNYDDLVQDLIEIIDAEKVDRATIVAESFGGTVGLAFAQKYPSRLQHLILVNTFPYFRRRFLLRLGKVFIPLAFHPLTKWARNPIMKVFLKNRTMDSEAINHVIESTWSQSKDTYKNRVRLIEDFDVRATLKNIDVPVTIIASAKDKLSPSVREAELMHQRLPRSRIIILPRHGHICLLSTEFSLANLVDPF